MQISGESHSPSLFFFYLRKIDFVWLVVRRAKLYLPKQIHRAFLPFMLHTRRKGSFKWSMLSLRLFFVFSSSNSFLFWHWMATVLNVLWAHSLSSTLWSLLTCTSRKRGVRYGHSIAIAMTLSAGVSGSYLRPRICKRESLQSGEM